MQIVVYQYEARSPKSQFHRQVPHSIWIVPVLNGISIKLQRIRIFLCVVNSPLVSYVPPCFNRSPTKVKFLSKKIDIPR